MTDEQMAAHLIQRGYRVSAPETPDSEAARHAGQAAMHAGYLSDLMDEGARLNAAAVGCLQAALRDLSLALRAHERQHTEEQRAA